MHAVRQEIVILPLFAVRDDRRVCGFEPFDGVSNCTFIQSETAIPHPPSTLLIEIATITARGLAGHPMKCGGERARLAEADIKRNVGYGQLTIRQ